MTSIRWRIFWNGEKNCLTTQFYETFLFDEPPGTLWSMDIAYDLITRLGYVKVVDIKEQDRIMNLRGGRK